MPKAKSYFGTKYGFHLRRRATEVLIKRKSKYNCPSCERGIVLRSGVGIWYCRKCDYTFAGGAYAPFTKVGQTASRLSVSARATSEG